jgi:hypothetical protein
MQEPQLQPEQDPAQQVITASLVPLQSEEEWNVVQTLGLQLELRLLQDALLSPQQLQSLDAKLIPVLQEARVL